MKQALNQEPLTIYGEGQQTRSFCFVSDEVEGIFRLSLHHFRAWAQTSIEVFICHDDIVWAQGPVFHPDWYRRNVIARYERLCA